MRIICLEEHILDPRWGAASAPLVAALSPQTADVGTGYQEPDEARSRIRPVRHWGPGLTQPAAERLAAMDEAGIDMQVLSYTNHSHSLPADTAPAIAREANEAMARYIAPYPDRFAAFATLPWSVPEAAIVEARRCRQDPGFCAVMLTGRPSATELIDAPRFEPVLAELAALRLPLYVHPGPPLPAVRGAYFEGFSPDVSARLSLHGWGWHHEAGLQLLRLILRGTLDRLRDLVLISGHWGEMVPFFLQRLDDSLPKGVTGLTRSLSQTYRDQVYVTPSGLLDLPHYRFVRDVLGSDRLLFSMDYPLLDMSDARDWLVRLGDSEADVDAFASGNAERLLGLR